jgi:hypothetical protein
MAVASKGETMSRASNMEDPPLHLDPETRAALREQAREIGISEAELAVLALGFLAYCRRDVTAEQSVVVMSRPSTVGRLVLFETRSVASETVSKVPFTGRFEVAPYASFSPPGLKLVQNLAPPPDDENDA